MIYECFCVCFCVESRSCHDISIRAIQSNLEPELICEKWFNFGTGKLVLKAALCFPGCNLSACRTTAAPRPDACCTCVISHRSLSSQPIFNNRSCLLCLGRLPGEHFADNLGDPQRGGREWDHNHRERDAQLLLHGVRQLGGPVQEAERSALQPGKERTSKETPPAETILAAENQNPRPHRCEHHRQMVTDNIPLQLLPLQHHLLALLCQLTHWCFLNQFLSLCHFWLLSVKNIMWYYELFFMIASVDYDDRTVTQAVYLYLHSHKEVSTEHVFYKDFHELWSTREELRHCISWAEAQTLCIYTASGDDFSVKCGCCNTVYC